MTAGIAPLMLASVLTFAANVEIRGEIVRFGDVSTLAALPEPLREKAAKLPIARVDPAAHEVSVPAEFLAAQARARLPALVSWLSTPQPGLVTLHRPAPVAMPRVRASGPGGVAKGAQVSVRITAGAFRLERGGVALYPARPGERLFVRTSEGQVITALCEGEAP